jgi:hypothetical protein
MSTTTTPTPPMTVAALLGDVRLGLDDGGLLSTALAGRTLTPGARRTLGREIADAVTTLLDIDLGDVVLDGWTGLRELRAAARRSRDTSGQPEEVPLATHQITSTHHPAVELHADGVTLGSLTFDLEISLELRGVMAVVRDGALIGVRGGEAEIAVSLARTGHVLAERRLTCPVGGLLHLGRGVPLVGSRHGDDSPGKQSSGVGRWRRAAHRAMGVVTVILVLAAGGFAARAFGMIPSDLRPEPGTSGVVREGTSWNVRSGPSTDAPVLGTVSSGQAVRVDCTTGGWARLLDPQKGAFVHTNGLHLDTSPADCVG